MVLKMFYYFMLLIMFFSLINWMKDLLLLFGMKVFLFDIFEDFVDFGSLVLMLVFCFLIFFLGGSGMVKGFDEFFCFIKGGFLGLNVLFLFLGDEVELFLICLIFKCFFFWSLLMVFFCVLMSFLSLWIFVLWGLSFFCFFFVEVDGVGVVLGEVIVVGLDFLVVDNFLLFFWDMFFGFWFLIMMGGCVLDKFKMLLEGDVFVVLFLVWVMGVFCNNEEFEVDGGKGEEFFDLGDNMVVFLGWGVMGIFLLDVLMILFMIVFCFGDMFVGNGIMIFLLFCDICDEKGFFLLLVNDSMMMVFLFGLSMLIVLGNVFFGLSFNIMEVDVGGGFIVICFGCVIGLISEEFVKLVGDMDVDWLFVDVEVNDWCEGDICLWMLLISFMSCMMFVDEWVLVMELVIEGCIFLLLFSECGFVFFLFNFVDLLIVLNFDICLILVVLLSWFLEGEFGVGDMIFCVLMICGEYFFEEFNLDFFIDIFWMVEVLLLFWLLFVVNEYMVEISGSFLLLLVMSFLFMSGGCMIVFVVDEWDWLLINNLLL